MLDKIREAAKPLWPNSLKFIMFDDESSLPKETNYDELTPKTLVNDLFRVKGENKSNVGYGGNMALKSVSFWLCFPVEESDPRLAEMEKYGATLAAASSIFSMEVIQGCKKSEKIIRFSIDNLHVSDRHKGHLGAVFKTGNLIEEAMKNF